MEEFNILSLKLYRYRVFLLVYFLGCNQQIYESYVGTITNLIENKIIFEWTLVWGRK